MTKLRVFISHSCKDAELDSEELDSGSVRLGDCPADATTLAQLRTARNVRDQIIEQLEGQGEIEILFDRKWLKPGVLWSEKLNHWLGVCHIGVVLLTPQSLRSDWVRKEATILCWRQTLGRTLVIPVLLHVADQEIEDAGFGPTGIAHLQAVRSPAPEAPDRDACGPSSRSNVQNSSTWPAAALKRQSGSPSWLGPRLILRKT